MTAQQKNKIFQTLLSGILITGTGIVMLSSQIPLIRKISEYSVYIMFGMLAASLISMIFNQTRIMFSGLACVTAMCIFLKDASHNTLKLPIENTEVKVNVAHFNLGNIADNFNELKDVLFEENIEIASFQELTPDWNPILDQLLKRQFPYSKSEVRIDPYGMAIYSKYPFTSSDIFDCRGKPNIQITIEKEDHQFDVVSSYLTPALDEGSIQSATEELDIIAKKIINSTSPVIALGEYNMVYWTNEIRDFRTKTNLTNSRRDLALRVPYDHIFFSDGLECTQFKELRDQELQYVGISGTYQIKGEKVFTTLNSQLSLKEQNQ